MDLRQEDHEFKTRPDYKGETVSKKIQIKKRNSHGTGEMAQGIKALAN